MLLHEILGLFEQGESHSEIGRKAGLTTNQVRRIADKHGFRKMKPEIRARNDEIVSLHRSGENVKDLARAFHLSESSIHEILKMYAQGGYSEEGKTKRKTKAEKAVERNDAEIAAKYQGELLSLQNQYEHLLDHCRKTEARHRDEIAALGRHIAALEMKHAEELEAAQ
jgi:transposase